MDKSLILCLVCLTAVRLSSEQCTTSGCSTGGVTGGAVSDSCVHLLHKVTSVQEQNAKLMEKLVDVVAGKQVITPAPSATPGTERYLYATAEVEPNKNYIGSNVRGVVHFRQKLIGDQKYPVEYFVNVTGFDHADVQKMHAQHIHTWGTIRDGCEWSAGHYDPTNTEHGLETDEIRHIGDLGNLEEDSRGNVFQRHNNDVLTLIGEHSIVGRTWDTHEYADDGLPPSGHAGRRVACGRVVFSDGSAWN